MSQPRRRVVIPAVFYMLRHLLSVLLLPVTVTILVPAWITRRNAVELTAPATATEVVLAGLGIALAAIGVVLFAASLWQFFAYGRGTLAPWDPPRRLVVRGPYRYVRNPMISGVIFILFGSALIMRSPAHTLWAVVFLAANLVYIPLIEEPMLADRFGPDYTRYRANVGRLMPRLTPWNIP
jgi:protein-S-isoprenylcysteine O-methyltransferase Ste14